MHRLRIWLRHPMRIVDIFIWVTIAVGLALALSWLILKLPHF